MKRLVVFVILMLLATAALAQTTICGYVYLNGPEVRPLARPLPGVVVTLSYRISPSGMTRMLQTITREDGSYAFPNLGPGNYMLATAARGLVSRPVVVTVRRPAPAQRMIVNLYMYRLIRPIVPEPIDATQPIITSSTNTQ